MRGRTFPGSPSPIAHPQPGIASRRKARDLATWGFDLVEVEAR